METILEQQRRYHEERERLMDAMFKEMMHTTKTVRPTFTFDFAHRYHIGTGDLEICFSVIITLFPRPYLFALCVARL